MSRVLALSILSAGLMAGAVFAKPNDAGSKVADPLPPVDALPPADALPLPPVDGTAPVLNSGENPLLNNSQPTVSLDEAKAKAERIKPLLTKVMTGLPMPEAKSRTTTGIGGQPLYDFDKLLNIGDSFGVMNKNAATIASTITGANKRYRLQAKNADGTPAFEPIKGADGAVIGQSTTPVMIAGKVFKAADVDPATFYPEGTPDEDKAPTRVWLMSDNSANGLPVKGAK